jgi:hypothetical protein
MATDIDSAKQYMDLMNRTRQARPQLIDQANESGDYSQVDQAQQTMDRLLAIGEHHLGNIKGAIAQDKQNGHEYAQGHPLAADAPGPSQDTAFGGGDDQAPQGNQPSAVPPVNAPSGSPESTAHEAARGAAKGIIEAQQQQKSALPGLHYAPGELKLEASPSALPAMDPADEAINKAYRIDKNGYDGEIENALSQARKIDRNGYDAESEEALRQARRISSDPEDREVQAYLDKPQDERDAEMRQHVKNLFGDPASQAMDDVIAAGKLPLVQGITPEQNDDAMQDEDPDVQAYRQLSPEDRQKDIEGHLARAFPEDWTQQGALPPVSPKPAPGPEEPLGESDASEPNPDDLAKVSPGLKAKYGNNGLKLAQDFSSQAPLSDMEREFVRRVQNELGPRPKLATVPKVLAALAVGVGGALGGWISGRYNGQSLMDMSADQREWDRERAEIGREVYQAHKLWGRVAAQMSGQMDKLAVQEQGRNDRLQTKEAGLDRRQDVSEQGKNERQLAALASKERVANIRAASTGKGYERMSVGDKAEIDRLKTAYNGIDRTLATVDPKVKAQADDLLRQMEEIIQKYPGRRE